MTEFKKDAEVMEECFAPIPAYRLVSKGVSRFSKSYFLISFCYEAFFLPVEQDV